MFNQILLYRNESCLKKKHLTLKVLHKTLVKCVCQGQSFTLKKTNNSIAPDIISVLRELAKEWNWILRLRYLLNSLCMWWDSVSTFLPNHFCFISAKTQNIHIGWLLNSFRPSSQRIVDKKRQFFSYFTWRQNRSLAG